jgi:hypothetical protein
MIKCNKCLKEFNTNLNRPEIIFPCQHIFCSECLIQANACLQCLNRIETKKLSQDVISEQTRLNKQQKLLKKYNQIKETNKSLILTSQLIKHSNESNVIKIQQEINTKANQLIAQINDQKNNLLQTVKNESNELNLKLNKIITHHVQMISDEKHPNLNDQIDLNKLDEHLKQIENKDKYKSNLYRWNLDYAYVLKKIIKNKTKDELKLIREEIIRFTNGQFGVIKRSSLITVDLGKSILIIFL